MTAVVIRIQEQIATMVWLLLLVVVSIQVSVASCEHGTNVLVLERRASRWERAGAQYLQRSSDRCQLPV